MKKCWLFLAPLCAMVLMAGCSTERDAEKAYTYLEKSASQEKGFNEQQKPIVEEEEREQMLYDKIMTLNMSQTEEVNTYAQEALEHIDAREKRMEKEKQSIDQAYETFTKAVKYLNRVKNKKALPHAKKMIANMKARHDAFGDLYAAYKQSIALDRELFKMLMDKNLTKDALQKQLTKVNQTYHTIENHKDRFNVLTDAFNKEKNSFYEILHLKKED
jgi:uncharacterized protein (UPF0335 family)